MKWRESITRAFPADVESLWPEGGDDEVPIIHT
jgi:hypothetical protein